MLVLVALSSITLDFTKDFAFQGRYEVTKDRYDKIKRAIIGRPDVLINGQPDISGFVADMGRLPDNIHDLLEKDYCLPDRTELDSTDCELLTGGVDWIIQTASGTSNGLKYGWNGPYITITKDPAVENAFPDGWGRNATGITDHNYGWNYAVGDLTGDGINDVTLQSFGKNQIATGNDYDKDYPVNQLVIQGADWTVDISSGIKVSFIKPNTVSQISSLPLSMCTEPTITASRTCTTPKTWYGGCNKVGYFNKTSCTASAGTWIQCSDGTSTDKVSCATNHWYGEGGGCSDQQYTDKAACIAATKVWRGCSDDGTIVSRDICLSSNQNWYGDSMYTVDLPSYPNPSPYVSNDICLKVYYRKSDSTVDFLTSDSVSGTPLNAYPIQEDGTSTVINFKNFRDSSDSPVSAISVGVNAIGVYEFTGGSCSATFYPDGRTELMPLLLFPRMNLSTVYW